MFLLLSCENVSTGWFLSATSEIYMMLKNVLCERLNALRSHCIARTDARGSKRWLKVNVRQLRRMMKGAHLAGSNDCSLLRDGKDMKVVTVTSECITDCRLDAASSAFRQPAACCLHCHRWQHSAAALRRLHCCCSQSPPSGSVSLGAACSSDVAPAAAQTRSVAS